MEIIAVEQTKYHEYEKLLLERDRLRKEAGSYMTEYTAEFGSLISDVFAMEIRCIEKKKAIAYCISMKNRNLKPDAKELDKYLKEQMEEYYEQLNEMLEATVEAKNAKTVSAEAVRECGKLYRKIVKMLHPDIHPETDEDEKLRDLWQKTMDAYTYSDVKALEELLLLAEAAVNDGNLSQIDIPDICDRIDEIQKEIDDIVSTVPYIYGEILGDSVKKAEEKIRYERELKKYKEYSIELENKLRSFGMEGLKAWQMN